MVDSAIILAGGKGERLRPLTNDRPKVMVEVAGFPIMSHQIEWLMGHGITKFVIACSYKYEVIQEYFGDGSKVGVQIEYSVEETPLGRGGGIKLAAQNSLIKNSENFVVTNGDIITKFNIKDMIKFHEENNGLVTDLVVPYISRWGIVKISDDNHVLGFEEKPKLPYWINGGIYIFNQKIVSLLPDKGDHEKETFPIIDKEKFLAFKDESFWRAVDVIKDRSEADAFLESGKTDFS